MIDGLNHVTLAVRDIEESFQFYVGVLGLKPVQKSDSSIYLLAGDAWLALVLDANARREPLAEYTHVAFTVSQTDFDALKKRIVQAGAPEWQKNRSEGDSFYFVDPNGHKLEIHTTDLTARIRAGKKEWGDEVQWFV